MRLTCDDGINGRYYQMTAHSLGVSVGETDNEYCETYGKSRENAFCIYLDDKSIHCVFMSLASVRKAIKELANDCECD